MNEDDDDDEDEDNFVVRKFYTVLQNLKLCILMNVFHHRKHSNSYSFTNTSLIHSTNLSAVGV